MKHLIGLAAATLLVAGSVCAETIASSEETLLKRAEQYKGHPLHEYMIPEGYKALWLILGNVKPYCREKANLNIDKCVSQRESAAKQLTEYGFDHVVADDFKDNELFILATDLQEFFAAKQKAIQAKVLKTPFKERPAIRAMANKMTTDSLALRSHIINSSKQ